MSTIKLHRFPLSGHSHRVELFLSLLGLDAEIITVDLANGAHKTPAFLQLNRFGQVPVLEDGDITLSDSNAIISYLASRYDGARRWLPVDGLAAAQVQRYLSIAAGLLAFGPATARLATVFGAAVDTEKATAMAHDLLAVLDAELDGRDWLVGERPTLADVANYTYIAHAPEGNVALDAYPMYRPGCSALKIYPALYPCKTQRWV